MSSRSDPIHDPIDVPATLGPYRIESRLGQGGMGEVYAGYDDRLDRPVALKRVRPGPPGHPPGRSRERRSDFQREARAVARLHHPALVQVHDWVETEDGEWMVMELVDGVSLREELRQGPLEPRRVLHLARDLLDGLRAAHGVGVVHRDLKAENVMLASGERAKILDFGLAERLPEMSLEEGDAEGDAGVDRESVGSEGDGSEESRSLMGTVTALAPEQVLGRPADHRSDLFSLGSLLYEMVTGAPPFYAGSPSETLRRICTFKPVSAATVRPEVPEGLSALIDRLLEKDPRRRPADAREALRDVEAILTALAPEPATSATAGSSPGARPVGGARSDPALAFTTLLSTALLDRFPSPVRHLAGWIVAGVLAGSLAGVMGAVWFVSRGAEPPLRYVAVPEPVIAGSEGVEDTGDAGEAGEPPSLERAASAVHTALLRGLLGFRGLAVLETPTAAATAGATGRFGEAGDPVRAARGWGADEVLTSRLDCHERTCQAVLRRLQAADGRVLWTRSFTVQTDSLLDLSVAVLGNVQGAYEDLEARAGALNLEVRPDDYQAFLDLRRRYDRREEGLSPEDVLGTLDRLQRSSPRFVGLYLFESVVRLRRFQEERDGGQLEAAEEALERARRLAPGDSQVLGRQAQVARIGGRLDEAEAFLETLLRLEPGNALPMAQLALLRERQGRPDEALRWMRSAVERLPSVGHLFDLADLLSRRGEVAGARQALERALGQSPDSYDGLSRLAQLELLSGSPARAAELYEQLVQRSPGVVELANLGTSYLLLERYPEAAARLRQAWEQAPSSAPALLNLADAELLQGRTEEAEHLYLEVIRQVDEDPSPDQLGTVRAQAQAHLGHTAEALVAAEEALLASPDNPQVLYEVALIEAVSGETERALEHARRALEAGVDIRWFGFPWFESVRSELADAVTD